MRKIVDLPDEEVDLKMSVCRKCNCMVCVAVKHMMTTKGKNSFLKDVFDYDLSVITVSLLEFRANVNNLKFCECYK